LGLEDKSAVSIKRKPGMGGRRIVITGKGKPGQKDLREVIKHAQEQFWAGGTKPARPRVGTHWKLPTQNHSGVQQPEIR